MSDWNFALYSCNSRNEDERKWPFSELLSRVHLTGAAQLVDLRRGPGNLTDLRVRLSSGSAVGIAYKFRRMHGGAGKHLRVPLCKQNDVGAWEAEASLWRTYSDIALQMGSKQDRRRPRLIAALAPDGLIALRRVLP